MLKIDSSYLKEVENKEDILQYFGEWTNDTKNLYNSFNSAIPFEHVVIPDFLSHNYVDTLSLDFPTDYSDWYKYINPIEVKYAYDDIEKLPYSIKLLFYLLSSSKIISLMREITGIEDLEYDEYLNGAGLHAHPKDGRLHIHLDYEKHPISGKQRRLNIILYMNKDWKDEWRGSTELWNNKECIAKSPVKFNTAILFKTNDISWHGLPSPLKCPSDIYRKTIAYYYVSPLKYKKSKYREKAMFINTSGIVNENLEKLYEIRKERRITKDDMERYLPDWSPSKY